MTEQAKPQRVFVRENIKREANEDDAKIYVSANTWMSRIISQVEDALNKDKKPSVTVRGLGRGAETVMRSRLIIQRITGCHALVKTELFNSDVKYVCEEDKTETVIRQSSVCVEITYSMEAPEDTKQNGYFAPLDETQKEAMLPRKDRRDNRRRKNGYFNRRRQRQQNEKKEEKEKKEEEKKEDKKEEKKEEKQQGRNQRNYNRRNYNGPRGYGKYNDKYQKK